MSISLLTYSNNGPLLSISCVGLQADPDPLESGSAPSTSLLQPGCTSLLSLSLGVTTGELAFLVSKKIILFCVKRHTLCFICKVHDIRHVTFYFLQLEGSSLESPSLLPFFVCHSLYSPFPNCLHQALLTLRKKISFICSHALSIFVYNK